MPPPAKSLAVAPLTWAQRSATANSPLPCLPIHPTGPRYPPRSMLSSSAISRIAVAVGDPATAAVGCTLAVRSSSEVSAASLPRTSVARCVTLGKWSTDGSAGTSSHEQNGARVSLSDWTP